MTTENERQALTQYLDGLTKPALRSLILRHGNDQARFKLWSKRKDQLVEILLQYEEKLTQGFPAAHSREASKLEKGQEQILAGQTEVKQQLELERENLIAYLETHIKVSWGERFINYLGSWASLVGLLIALIPMFWPSEAYHIKILVLDEDGAHAKGTTVKAPPGKVVARDNYWALSIPRDEVPADGRVRVTAQKGQGYDEKTVELTHRNRFSINLKLRYPNALMKGVVLGPDGNPAGGVRITVFEHEQEAVLTSEDGTFSLPAHKAVGEEVRVTAKKGTWGRVGVYEAGRHNEIRLIDRSASD